MLATEAEAAKLWCPQTKDKQCLGSQCMLWQWDWNTAERRDGQGGYLPREKPTHGYCGLGGNGCGK